MELGPIIRYAQLLAIESGRLTLLAADQGRQTNADHYLKANYDNILECIIEVTNVPAFRFIKHTSGVYHNGKAEGVILHFLDIRSGEIVHCAFNGTIRRQRSVRGHEAGKRLPKGRFIPPKHGAFIKFWRSTGLAFARSPSEYHECMGRLKPLVFTGCLLDGNKLDKNSLTPLNLEFDRICEAVLGDAPVPGITPVKPRLLPGNYPVNMLGKEVVQTQQPRGIQPISTTAQHDHDSRSTGTRLEESSIAPEKQTTDQWLEDFDRALAS